MNDSSTLLSDIVILLHDTEQDYPVAERLLTMGHTVYICGSHAELMSLYQQGKRPRVLAHIDYTPPLNEPILQSLLQGARPLDADVLHQLGLQATTFEVFSDGMTARPALFTPSEIETPPATDDATWVLAQGTRRMTLEAPDGSVIRLTPTESRFLQTLFSSPSLTVERDDWKNQNGGKDQRDIHNLAVIVSRLRLKISQRGLSFPLRVMRGAGYFFAGKCRIET